MVIGEMVGMVIGDDDKEFNMTNSPGPYAREGNEVASGTSLASSDIADANGPASHPGGQHHSLTRFVRKVVAVLLGAVALHIVASVVSGIWWYHSLNIEPVSQALRWGNALLNGGGVGDGLGVVLLLGTFLLYWLLGRDDEPPSGDDAYLTWIEVLAALSALGGLATLVGGFLFYQNMATRWADDVGNAGGALAYAMTGAALFALARHLRHDATPPTVRESLDAGDAFAR